MSIDELDVPEYNKDGDNYYFTKQELEAFIAQETTKAINDYQTNEEQRHIASAVALARIEETKLWYNDWGNGKEQIGDGSWEDFYEWRIAKLKGDDK